MKELEVNKTSSGLSRDNFDVSKYIKLVPKFNESDVDSYFVTFEKVANNVKWPKGYWSLLL